MKNYTKNEETCIGKLLQQIAVDKPSESIMKSIRELHEAALRYGVHLDKCEDVVGFLMKNHECVMLWLKLKDELQSINYDI